MTAHSRRLRVIQWATGAVGTEMINTILDHRPDLELVGARVYSDFKDGVDVGTLADRSPIGVTATTDVAEILARDADIVLYTPSFTSLDDVCALLESGKNVATVSFLFHPRRIGEADRRRLLAACKKGNSTIHASGLNPGNLSGVLPLALSGMSRTIDRFTLQERADWSLWESTGITFDGMWFGRPPEDITPTANEFLTFNTALFTQQAWFIADTLNAAIDDVTVSVDAVPATKDFQIFDHQVRAGTPGTADSTTDHGAFALPILPGERYICGTASAISSRQSLWGGPWPKRFRAAARRSMQTRVTTCSATTAARFSRRSLPRVREHRRKDPGCAPGSQRNAAETVNAVCDTAIPTAVSLAGASMRNHPGEDVRLQQDDPSHDARQRD